MQILTFFIAVSVFVAAALCDDNVIVPTGNVGSLLASTRGNPGNSANGPGSTSPETMYPGEIQKWSYPNPSTLKPWPQQPSSSKRGECSLNITVAVGSCKSGAYGYKPQFIPYDDASTKAIGGKVRFVVNHDKGNFYDYSTVVVDCYWRGRIMVTDTPEIQSRIGLVSVRVDTSPTEMRAWITDDPDEDETKMKQSQVASVSFVEFGGHQANNKNFLNGARGFQKSLQKSAKKVDNLYIQVC